MEKDKVRTNVTNRTWENSWHFKFQFVENRKQIKIMRLNMSRTSSMGTPSEQRRNIKKTKYGKSNSIRSQMKWRAAAAAALKKNVECLCSEFHCFQTLQCNAAGRPVVGYGNIDTVSIMYLLCSVRAVLCALTYLSGRLVTRGECTFNVSVYVAVCLCTLSRSPSVRHINRAETNIYSK